MIPAPPTEPCDACDREPVEHGLGQYMLCDACWRLLTRKDFKLNMSAAGMARARRREAWYAQRRPVPAGVRGEGTPWHAWFDGEEYLGERSARTGPDVVTADEKARQAADVAPGRTNGKETT